MNFKELLEKYKIGIATEEERRIVEEELEKFEAINDFEYDRFEETIAVATSAVSKGSNSSEANEEPYDPNECDKEHDSKGELIKECGSKGPIKEYGSKGLFKGYNPNRRCKETEVERNFTTSIQKEIRKAFVRMGLITGIVVMAVTLMVIFALPQIVSAFYYDPGKIVGEAKDGDEVIGQTNRMSLDLSVYTEMMVPQTLRQDVTVDDNGYGEYDICINQTAAYNHEGFHNYAGRIQRGKLILYENDALKRMVNNTFGWYDRNSVKIPLKKQDENESKYLGEKEAPCYGIISRSGNREFLEELNEDQTYYAYVTLNEMMEYEDFYKFFQKKNDSAFGWCAVKTTDVADDMRFETTNMGFVFSPTSYSPINYDKGKYPALSLEFLSEKENAASESRMRQHFISMLNYMKDNSEFYKMMGIDEDENYFERIAEYVKKNGIIVYGFVTRGTKDQLLELMDKDEVYTVYVE